MADETKGAAERRGFLKVAAVALGAVGGAILQIPGVANVLDPLLRRTASKSEWRPLGAIDQVERSEHPVALPVIGERVDAWTRAPKQTLGTVWLRKKGDAVEALSAECPHLGCRVGYDESKKNFVCPCHESAFDLEGKVLYGPSPRAMDTLEARVNDGVVEVKFQRFQPQIKDKVEA